MMTISLGTMIEQIAGLCGTDDLTAFEDGFVSSIFARYRAAQKDTRWLSERQVEILDSIWSKNFAG
jgi:hypothetical protein